jgi:hypothetical protein
MLNQRFGVRSRLSAITVFPVLSVDRESDMLIGYRASPFVAYNIN